MIYQTTLAKVAAKWTPPGASWNVGEVHALMREKIAALDFAPANVQAMLSQIDAQLVGEDNLSRRRTLTEARAGLAGAFEGGRPATHLFAIFDVFAYWPAAEEVAADSVPPAPSSMEDKLQRLSEAVRRHTGG